MGPLHARHKCREFTTTIELANFIKIYMHPACRLVGGHFSPNIPGAVLPWLEGS